MVLQQTGFECLEDEQTGNGSDWLTDKISWREYRVTDKSTDDATNKPNPKSLGEFRDNQHDSQTVENDDKVQYRNGGNGAYKAANRAIAPTASKMPTMAISCDFIVSIIVNVYQNLFRKAIP